MLVVIIMLLLMFILFPHAHVQTNFHAGIHHHALAYVHPFTHAHAHGLPLILAGCHYYYTLMINAKTSYPLVTLL